MMSGGKSDLSDETFTMESPANEQDAIHKETDGKCTAETYGCCYVSPFPEDNDED